MATGALLTIVSVLFWPQNNSPAVEGDASNNDAQALTLQLDLPDIDSYDLAITSQTESISTMTIEVNNGDTLGELFTKNNLSYDNMLAILNNQDAKKYLTRLKPGDKIGVKPFDNTGQIQSLHYQVDDESTLTATRKTNGAFSTELIKTPLDVRVAYAHGSIKDSLFLAGMQAGMEDRLIMNLAGIFRWDIDFVLDIRKNDNFTVIYEELWKNGEKLRTGNILAAEFTNNGKSFHAIRFEDENGDSNFYSPDGKSMKKAFLRAPIKFTPRVTSSFNPRRMHPVHKRVRPHRGVDYGGPLNTPIIAAGDGKVIFRGRKGGYGNCVIIQHGGNITTLYAHLNKFNRKVRHGSRVKQGQTIGYLGATGTVTAKHLHYEYRVNGVHRNPRTVKLPNAKPLPKKHKADFEQVKNPLLTQLDVIKRANTLQANTDNISVSGATGASAAQ
ncbi:MAG: peptidoglycan DD-metalloendopeptidase family protein [Gammaproteobacteria bacterium]|nr:peptidoglycan DD-metalloendopeptidase family protein [Gammaproteobacteria bacterium]